MSCWVLLRGLARESRHWGGFPALLAAMLPEGTRVIALDLPGNGALRHVASPSSVPAMVEAYRVQLPRLGTQGPLNILGLSLGAMVAAEWSHRYPAEVASCVMVNGSVSGLSPPWRRLRPASWLPLLATALPGRSAQHREAAILRLCSHSGDPAASSLWAALAEQAPTQPANALRQLRAAMRYRLPPQPPASPVLLLASRLDRLVDCGCTASIAAAWKRPWIAHPGAGHELALDDPAWLARQCAAFTAGD